MTLSLPLQAQVLDTLAHHLAPVEQTHLPTDPDLLHAEVAQVAHAHGLVATPDQIAATVRQLLGPTTPSPTPTLTWDRPPTLAAIEQERAALNQEKSQYQTEAAVGKRGFWRLLIGSAAAGALLGPLTFYETLGPPDGLSSIAMAATVGIMVIAAFVSLPLLTFSSLPGSEPWSEKLNKKIHRVTRRATELEQIVPTTEQMDRWTRVPALTAQAQACLKSPMGLLRGDVKALEAAYAAQKQALQHDEHAAALAQFLSRPA